MNHHIEPATQYFNTDGGRLAYDDTGGDKPLVIALPGMGELRQQYRTLRPALCLRGYRFVTLDVRGQGASSVHWNDYSAHAAGRDVLALMQHLNVQDAVVIGNSFAAGAAIWAAHLAPAMIRGLVLLAPILRDLPTPLWLNILIKIGFMGPWSTTFWMRYWDSLFPSQKPLDHAQYRVQLESKLREPGRIQALKTMVERSKADTEAILSEVHHPCLIVMGTKDPDFQNPEQEAKRLATQLHADVLLANGSGHYPHVDLPEQICPKIVTFIKQVTSQHD